MPPPQSAPRPGVAASVRQCYQPAFAAIIEEGGDSQLSPRRKVAPDCEKLHRGHSVCPPNASHTTELARLLNSAKQPIYVLDEDLTIVFLNRACQEWLGAAPKGSWAGDVRTIPVPRLSGPDAVAAGLCPPPQVSGGRDRRGHGLPSGRRRHADRAAGPFSALGRRRGGLCWGSLPLWNGGSTAGFRRRRSPKPVLRATVGGRPKPGRSPCTNRSAASARRPPPGIGPIG